MTTKLTTTGQRNAEARGYDMHSQATKELGSHAHAGIHIDFGYDANSDVYYWRRNHYVTGVGMTFDGVEHNGFADYQACYDDAVAYASK